MLHFKINDASVTLVLLLVMFLLDMPFAKLKNHLYLANSGLQNLGNFASVSLLLPWQQRISHSNHQCVRRKRFVLKKVVLLK
jgi:hypothetical protein